MQGNGLKIGLTIFFLALCGYYLYPSVQNLFISQQLDALEGEELEQYRDENAANIRQVKSESLKLGLDLLGGMHVTLEVRVPDLLAELGTDKDEAFNQALAGAREAAQQGEEDIVAAFIEAFEAQDANARLSRYFRSDDANIGRRSTNSEVADYLRTESDEAVTRAMEIIRNRVDRYGVTEPSIQKQGNRRVVVELPGIDDAERVRNLLRGTARLEFRLMAEPQQLAQSAQRIIQYYETAEADSLTQDPAPGDTADGSSARLAEAGDGDGADTADTGTRLTGGPDTTDEQAAGTRLSGEDPATGDEPQNPLLASMQPLPFQQSVVFGRVLARDTATVNRLLGRSAVQKLLPSGIELMYAASPVGATEEGEEAFDLLGIREDVELAGDAITDASVQFRQSTNQPLVSMSMNSEGARTWARITGANVGRNVAVVLDNVVYSYPTINERIVGGGTEISGLESRAEAQDIVTVLQSGALPAPVDIVEERTVGPSLGAESITAGLTSVLVGLLIVAIFMIFYYHTAGVVADLALLLNLVFILGILAGFNATLTLPGIAGIVLTIGMAVDANVLIFERIREEQNTGKTLRAAIDSGYSKALSAILDANITTFFVGAILYSFGVGPIQGFAVTLMAGILSSMFTAIIVTRIVFDYMVVERGMSVSYG